MHMHSQGRIDMIEMIEMIEMTVITITIMITKTTHSLLNKLQITIGALSNELE